MLLFQRKWGITHLASSHCSIKVNENGMQLWHRDWKWHRGHDMPAVIHENGYKQWWVNDRFIRDEDPRKQ